MKVTHIQTEDGKAKVEWWEKEDFHGRSTRVYTAESTEDFIAERNLKLVGVSPVPDDVILCDFCNVKIEEFPVPVMRGTYALCKECLENVKKEDKESVQ